MKYALVIVSLLFSLKSIAQNCGSMAEGESIRLDEKNKSLENYKIQDQDGLGVCYANAASLLLQGNLEGNPELSYIHLATLYKTKSLANQRSSSKSADDFNIYAKPVTGNQKAINGGGDAMKWDLALDGGNTCEVISTIKSLQAKAKKPVICKKSEMNFEKILNSADSEHRQFKTILQSSVYMNQFQKTFGDLAEKPNWFTKKRVLQAQEKYNVFKSGFQELISKKIKKLEEIECKKVNADYLEPVVEPMIQLALAYRICFAEENTNENAFVCKVIKGIAGNAKLKSDGNYEDITASKEWLKDFKKKIEQKKGKFDAETLSDDMASSFVDGLGIKEEVKKNAITFFKERFINQTKVIKNLEKLSTEYNEVIEKGFSPACITRNTYNYFETPEYEKDWSENVGLCSYADLMKQAANVVIKYKESGLDDIKALMEFITTNAGDKYDAAMMSLYASDCEDEGKFSIPEKVQCTTLSASSNNKSTINEKIIEKLKSNKPLTASLCAAILKKPKSQFAADECGHHALGITGIQCNDGKLRYMIQNSWGPNTMAGPGAVGIENIIGKGAYWFDEETFYDSVYAIDFLN